MAECSRPSGYTETKDQTIRECLQCGCIVCESWLVEHTRVVINANVPTPQRTLDGY